MGTIFEKRKLRKLKEQLGGVVSQHESKINQLNAEVKRLGREAATKPKSLQFSAQQLIATKLKLLKMEENKLILAVNQQAAIQLKSEANQGQDQMEKLNKRLRNALKMNQPGALSEAINEWAADIEEETELYTDELSDIQVSRSGVQSTDTDLEEARRIIEMEEDTQKQSRMDAIQARMRTPLKADGEFEEVFEAEEPQKEKRKLSEQE